MSKQPKKSLPEQAQLGLRQIEVLSFNVSLPRDPELQKRILEEKRDLQYNLSMGHRAFTETNSILITVFVTVKNHDATIEIASLAVNFRFELENMKDFQSSDNEDQVDIPDNLVAVFNAISLSTTRGILFEKTRGTIAEGFMPIIDGNLFVPKTNPNESSS